MRIDLVCRTNATVPYVNAAVFRTAHGDVTIDRTNTYYTYDSVFHLLEIDWCGCYVWDGKDENFDLPERLSDEILSLVRLGLEDDAEDELGDEYYCEPILCAVDGREISILQDCAI